RTRSLAWIIAVLVGPIATVRPGAASAQVEFYVTTSDLTDEAKAVEALIKSNLITAASAWAAFVDARPCKLHIAFRLDPNASSGRGSGKSVVSARLGKETH